MHRSNRRRIAIIGGLAAALTVLMGADGCEFKCEAKEDTRAPQQSDTRFAAAEVRVAIAGPCESGTWRIHAMPS